MKSNLMFVDFTDKKKTIPIPLNAYKIPKTFRQISESRDRKKKFASKNISANISFNKHKQKYKKFQDIRNIQTSRSPNIENKNKQNMDQFPFKSQIAQRNKNQKGLKFNPNKKGKKLLEQNTKIIKKSIIIQEKKEIIYHNQTKDNSYSSENVMTSTDYSQIVFDMSPTLLKF